MVSGECQKGCKKIPIGYFLFCFTDFGILIDKGLILAVCGYHLSVTGNGREFSHGFNLVYLGEGFCIFSYDKVCSIADSEEIVCGRIGEEEVVGERDD